MAAGSLLTASQKAGPELAVMPSHAVSAKSQTLENKAYHVMSFHVMPAVGGQVGDEGGEPLSLYALKQGGLSLIKKASGPQSGPLPSLDDVMVSVSAQWDELSDAEKVVIGLILNRETVEQGATPASADTP